MAGVSIFDLFEGIQYAVYNLGYDSDRGIGHDKLGAVELRPIRALLDMPDSRPLQQLQFAIVKRRGAVGVRWNAILQQYSPTRL
jgi:hypothetical protein